MAERKRKRFEKKLEIGSVWNSKKCGNFTIIDKGRRETGSQWYKIRFHTTGTELVRDCQNIREGKVFDKNFPYLYGVACQGYGYSTKDHEREYRIWQHMVRRCYKVGDYAEHNYRQKGVYVCDEWLNFQNFCQWLIDQGGSEGKEIDKDLLSTTLGVTPHYSPETCCIMPKPLNILLVSQKPKVLKDLEKLPPGVTRTNSVQNPYIARGNIPTCLGGNGKPINLGRGNNPQELFLVYKQHKEEQIRLAADHYYSKGQIDRRTYEALYKIRVGETSLYHEDTLQPILK